MIVYLFPALVLSHVIFPKRDPRRFSLRFKSLERDILMPWRTFATTTTTSSSWMQERVRECPARPLLSGIGFTRSNSLLKVSAVPAFETRIQLVGTVPAEQLVAQTECLSRSKSLSEVTVSQHNGQDLHNVTLVVDWPAFPKVAWLHWWWKHFELLKGTGIEPYLT